MGVLLLFGVLVVAACGQDSPTVAVDGSETSTTATTAVEIEVVDSLDDDTPDRGFDIDGERIGPDPLEDEPIWRCGDELTLSFDVLAEFDALPDAAPEALATAGRYDQLGDPTNWAQLADGWIVDRRLLDTSPAALFVADARHGGTDGCVPIRSTRMRPVAWEQIGEITDRQATVAFEPCVAPEDVVVDLRNFGGDALLGLFASGSDGIDCIVDGSATITLDVGEAATLLSSQTWPFVAGDPAAFVSDAPHPQIVPVTSEAIEVIECAAASPTSIELYVEFAGLPAGVPASFFVNGQHWLDHESSRSAAAANVDRVAEERRVAFGNEPSGRSGFDGGYSFFGADLGQTYLVDLHLDVVDGDPVVVPCGSVTASGELPVPECSVIEVGGAPYILVDGVTVGADDITIVRDGEPLDLGFQLAPVDVTAEPGVSYIYEVEIIESSVRASCGSFVLEPPRDEAERLTDAKERFENFGAGAHYYMTLIAPEGSQIEAVMTFTGNRFVFVAPDDVPSSADPHSIHDRLLAALAEGRAVQFEIDPWAGVITDWSIDGEAGLRTICLSVDTAPPELRTARCDPESDLIGRRTF